MNIGELRPCPWCGGRADFRLYSQINTRRCEFISLEYEIKCTNCGATNGRHFYLTTRIDPAMTRGATADVTGRDEAIKEWNRRAGEPENEPLTEDEQQAAWEAALWEGVEPDDDGEEV